MDVIDAIRKRQSVRKYKSKSIDKNIISELIEAARLAPSGNNAQPWKFKIIVDKQEKQLLKENDIFKQDFVYTAPLIILCCGDSSAYPQKKIERGLDDVNELRAMRDLSIASQNLILRATELGLGTCYVGWMKKLEIKQLFNIPENYIAPYVITIGYSDEELIQVKKKKVEDILL